MTGSAEDDWFEGGSNCKQGSAQHVGAVVNFGINGKPHRHCEIQRERERERCGGGQLAE